MYMLIGFVTKWLGKGKSKIEAQAYIKCFSRSKVTNGKKLVQSEPKSCPRDQYMSHVMRKLAFCICENKDAMFVFVKMLLFSTCFFFVGLLHVSRVDGFLYIGE